jgi:PKD repeat protein
MRSRWSICLHLGIGAAFVLAACRDNQQSPSGRTQAPDEDLPEASNLATIDLVYVCGNKFLATNSTRSPVAVTYRVVGTNETGSLTLPERPGGDPWFSEMELETVERGAVELYLEDDLATRRRNQGLPCGASPSFAIAAGASSASAGQWGAAFSWPHIAVHLSLLPTGKVLSFGLSGTPGVWNPVDGSFTSIPSPAVIFCAGHSFLADGRLLVSGGNSDPNVGAHGIPDNTIFDPATQSWSRATPMRYARWYPTNTTLGNGDVLILAGRDGAGVNVREHEIWSNGTLRVLSTAALALPLYPRAFLARDGKVFVAGEARATRFLDPTVTGSWTTGPSRLYGVRDYGAAVMYDDGKILYVGGGRTTNTAEIIDLNSAAPAWQWTGSMAFPRRHLNATVLPTGEVLVTGGTSGITFNDYAASVHAAELWNPATGLWTTLASNAVNRAYHSTSILLPDGRILHSGSGDGGPNQRNAELFSPPYLFKGPRPTITASPSGVAYGTSFNVTTPNAADISKVSLIRLGSTTHAFDMNQRFQWLSFSREPGALVISPITSRNRTPPGHYMLFVLNRDAVPSVAKIIHVGSSGNPEPPPSNKAPSANFTADCSGFSCDFRDGSIDSDGEITAWAWTFGDGRTSVTPSPSHTYTTGGTYDVTLIVTDDDGATNQRSARVTVGTPSSIALSATGRSDPTTQYMTLDWSGANGATVDVFRNGVRITNTPNDGHYTNSRTYQGAITYVYKVCEAGSATCSNEATVEFGGGAPPPNTAPKADFSYSCSGLTCGFTDASTDGDGTVTAWSWTFGDGTGSSAKNPSRTYAVPGTYTVALTATDDDGAKGSASKQVTVSAPSSSINLAATGRSDATTQYITLTWTGAVGAMVDVYRNGVLVKTTENDGRYVNARTFVGAATYRYKVCQAGTMVCSNEATVTF